MGPGVARAKNWIDLSQTGYFIPLPSSLFPHSPVPRPKISTPVHSRCLHCNAQLFIPHWDHMLKIFIPSPYHHPLPVPFPVPFPSFLFPKWARVHYTTMHKLLTFTSSVLRSRTIDTCARHLLRCMVFPRKRTARRAHAMLDAIRTPLPVDALHVIRSRTQHARRTRLQNGCDLCGPYTFLFY